MGEMHNRRRAMYEADQEHRKRRRAASQAAAQAPMADDPIEPDPVREAVELDEVEKLIGPLGDPEE